MDKKEIIVKFVNWSQLDNGLYESYYSLPNGKIVSKSMLPKRAVIKGYVPLDIWFEQREKKSISIVKQQKKRFVERISERKVKKMIMDVKLVLYEKLTKFGFSGISETLHFCKELDKCKKDNQSCIIVSKPISTQGINVLDKPMDIVIPQNSIVQFETISFKTIKVKYIDKVLGELVITLDNDIAKDSLMTIDAFIFELGKEFYLSLVRDNLDNYIRSLVVNNYRNELGDTFEKEKVKNLEDWFEVLNKKTELEKVI